MPYQKKKKRRSNHRGFSQSLFLLSIGNQRPMPALNSHDSHDMRNGKINTLKSRPYVRKVWGIQNLPSALAYLPERFETGKRKASPMRDDGESAPVVLIRMPPMFSQDGNKDAQMVHRSTERSKKKGIGELSAKSIDFSYHYAGTNGSFKKEQRLMPPYRTSPPKMLSGCLCVIQLSLTKKSKRLSLQFVKRARQREQCINWFRNFGICFIIGGAKN